MFIQLVCFLFITSCGVQFFELLGELPFQALRMETYQITWANAVYFAVVTVMTVGYGDFSPYTFLGRMWVVSHIIFAAVLLSRGISLLMEALQSMRRGSGSYVNSPGSKHVVVTGRVKWEFLRQFVIEFLEEPSNLDTRLIVLASNPDWTEDVWNHFVDQKPLFNHHLVYLEGSALQLDDLYRAHVHSARAVFVLADPHHEDPYKEDSDILKSVLTIRNYSATVPVYTLNILNDSSFQFGIALEHLAPEYDMQMAASNIYPSIPVSSRFIGATSVQKSIIPEKNNPLLSMDFAQIMEDDIAEYPVEAVREPEPITHEPVSASINATPVTPNEIQQSQTPIRLPSADWFADGVEQSKDLRNQRSSLQRATRNAKNRKSVSLCMQEIETMLLSESIFCNGLSTLIANASLRVAPQSSSRDRPWLMEYKLGAECSVQQFEIREEMDSLTVADVATVLLDYGLVLLAVRDSPEADWTISTTEIVLRSSMVAMALSYHDQTVIDRIADHAAACIGERDRQRRSDIMATAPTTAAAPSPMDDSSMMAGIVNTTGPALSDSTCSLNRPIYQPVRSGIPSILDDEPRVGDGGGPSSGREPLRRPSNIDGNDQQAQTHPSLLLRPVEQANIFDTSRALPSSSPPFRSRPSSSPPFQDDDSQRDGISSASINIIDTKSSISNLPINAVSSANIVAQPVTRRRRTNVSDAPPPGPSNRSRTPSSRRESGGNAKRKTTQRIYSTVDKLPAALRGHVIICVDGETSLMNLDVLVRRIWMRRTGQKRRAPIVVIHPRFPKNFARRLGGDQSGLFLLQGNSLSLGTLKQAQYQSARAFLIMASETKEHSAQGSTDSKAIFTVMALDTLLAGRNTFVCCVLDAEASLQLLPVPREARRIGGLFDEAGRNDGNDPVLSGGDAASSQNPHSLHPSRTTSMNTIRGQSRLGSMRNLSRYGALNASNNNNNNTNNGTATSGRTTSRRRFGGGGLRSRGLTRSGSMRLEQNGENDDSEDEDDDDEYGILTGLGGTRLRDSDFNNEKRSREERYERDRYASGEMIISSLFTSLLAREYTDPGYIRLIRQLIGATSSSRGSWIRHVAIPESWMSVEKAIGGRTYRELSSKLLGFGCIALGLYRSGDAPVRKELKSELWIRGVDEVVYSSEDDEANANNNNGYHAQYDDFNDYGSGGGVGLGADMYADYGYAGGVRGSGGGRRSTSREMVNSGKWLDGSCEQPKSLSSSHNMQYTEGFPLLTDDGDEFDQMTYICPSTRRRIFYQESENGENVLPYVYSCPEPYTAVVSSDLVFVLSNPKTVIPTDWEDD